MRCGCLASTRGRRRRTKRRAEDPSAGRSDCSRLPCPPPREELRRRTCVSVGMAPVLGSASGNASIWLSYGTIAEKRAGRGMIAVLGDQSPNLVWMLPGMSGRMAESSPSRYAYGGTVPSGAWYYLCKSGWSVASLPSHPTSDLHAMKP